MPPMTDADDSPARELLARGRQAAFAELYDRHAARMLAVARVLTGSTTDAEDAVQQTFLDLYRARHALARAERPQAYAFRALRNAALRIRERRREAELADELPAPASADGTDTAALERALARLPADQREVITLKVDAELTFAEIGRTLEISPNTAASRYRYALERLRDALGGAR